MCHRYIARLIRTSPGLDLWLFLSSASQLPSPHLIPEAHHGVHDVFFLFETRQGLEYRRREDAEPEGASMHPWWTPVLRATNPSTRRRRVTLVSACHRDIDRWPKYSSMVTRSRQVFQKNHAYSGIRFFRASPLAKERTTSVKSCIVVWTPSGVFTHWSGAFNNVWIQLWRHGVQEGEKTPNPSLADELNVPGQFPFVVFAELRAATSIPVQDHDLHVVIEISLVAFSVARFDLCCRCGSRRSSA